MCKIYLANRAFGYTERGKIRDHFTHLGPGVTSAIRRAASEQAAFYLADFDRRIAEKQATLKENPPNSHALGKEIKFLETQKANQPTRTAELEELADVIEACAKDQAARA